MIGRSTGPAFDSVSYAGAAAPDLRISTEKLRCLMLWLTGACGAIVFIEPSPYEVMSALTMGLFMIGGLTLSPVVIPPAVLLVLINIGYSISGWTVIDQENVVMWLITSWYLAFTAIFFAATLGRNTEGRLNALARGCVIGGI